MQQPASPIIVKIVEPPGDPTGLSQILLGALGLSGAILLVALVLGVLFGAILFWLRARTS